MKAAGAKLADPDRDRHHLSRSAITGAIADCPPLCLAQAGARGRPSWWQVVGATHCGAGGTLGDIIGERLVFALGWALFGKALYADYFVDFGLAYVLGVLFRYFSIAPMRGLGLKDGLVAAVKADTMSLSRFVLFPRESAASWTHWFMMQVGMIIGSLTSYPANWWLIRKGVKEAM